MFVQESHGSFLFCFGLFSGLPFRLTLSPSPQAMFQIELRMDLMVRILGVFRERVFLIEIE
jgi:hypothetical protein